MKKGEVAIEIARKVLADFKREYSPETFKISNPEKVKERDIDKFNFPVWEISVDVPDEQFGGQSPYFIFIKDETMDPIMFFDCGAPGRVPKLEIIKKDGRYTIGNIWKE